jgi:hypothetical protein
MNERDLSQALSTGLAGTALFRWGWAALESDIQPPSLPLVTLTRLQANADALADMCAQDPAEGETTVETHAWARVYEDARALQDQVRATILPTGWRLLAEQDAYDGVFRAWRISAQWAGFGVIGAPGPSPPSPPPPEMGGALFVPLTRVAAPPPIEPPPPLRAFSSGFDKGFE